MAETLGVTENAKDLLVEMRDQIGHAAILPEAVKLFAHCYAEMKDKVHHLYAETELRQKRIHLLNDLICSINNLTDEKNELDLRQNPELQERLTVAKEMGANIKVEKWQFDSIGRDRLIQNLSLKAEEWTKENQRQLQEMQVCYDASNKILILMNEVKKAEDKPKRSAIAGTKGA